MSGKIAVFSDINGAPTDFYSAERIDIYTQDNEKWSCSEKITLAPFDAKSAAQVRGEAARRLELTDGCDIIASKELAGIPFAVFDMAGKSIFTVNEINGSLLNDMAKEVEEAESMAAANSLSPGNITPVETG